MAKITRCVVDVETGGLSATKHDLLAVSVLPVDEKLEPICEPLVLRIKSTSPDRLQPKALEINGLDPNVGATPEVAKEVFIAWLKNNKIKKIKPIGQNYKFDKSFLLAWLKVDYYSYFSDDVIDTMVLAEVLNMKAAIAGREKVFQKANLKYLCEVCGIEQVDAHTAAGDCITTLAILRKMLTS